MKAVIVSGTPGTGKTTLAKKLSLSIGYTYFDVASYIRKAHLYEGFDRKRGCYVVDPKRLAKALGKVIRDSAAPLVIDHHMSHFLPVRSVSLAVIASCPLRILRKRLEKRGYDREKVRDNLDAEIFETSLSEARSLGHRVFVADTGLYRPDELVLRIAKMLKKASQ